MFSFFAGSESDESDAEVDSISEGSFDDDEHDDDDDKHDHESSLMSDGRRHDGGGAAEEGRSYRTAITTPSHASSGRSTRSKASVSSRTEGSSSSARSNRSRGGSADTAAAAGSRAQAGRNSANDDENDDEGSSEDEEEEEEEEPLTQSSRLKGYITLIVASTVHYDSAKDSDLQSLDKDSFLRGVVPADETQRSYAMAVSMITLIVSLFCAIVHFDRFTCLKGAWMKAFKPGSKIELILLIALVIWWVIATWVLTSVTGIAGPGKGHFNLYFSTWCCLFFSTWTLERWLVAANLSSMTRFMESWPNRAPGWIVTFITSIGAMLATLDLYLNWYKTGPRLQLRYSSVGKHQWVWLIFVPALSIPVSAGFFLIELFRVTRLDGQNIKSDRENMFEGLCACILVFFWVPTLFIATTPGGAADQVGNAYFFIWGASIVVTETFLWWVRDWRMAIHDVMRMQQEEYKRAQQLVLKKHQEEAEKVHAENVGDKRNSIGEESAEMLDMSESEHRVTFIDDTQ